MSSIININNATEEGSNNSKFFNETTQFIDLKNLSNSVINNYQSSNNGIFSGDKKKAGKAILNISGTRHYSTNKRNINPKNFSVEDVNNKREYQLVKSFLNQIEESVNNVRDLYLLTKNLIKLIYEEPINKHYREAAMIAIESDAIINFVQRYFKSIYCKFFDPEKQKKNTINFHNFTFETFAIPFDEKRDSFPMREEETNMLLPRYVYDNRQKLRDGFIYLLQEFMPLANERQMITKAKELVFSKLVYMNASWFGELLLGEYLKWFSKADDYHEEIEKKSKMERLERRFKPKSKSITSQECFEFFCSLLKNGDSFSLILELTKQISFKIKQFEENCCDGLLRRGELFKEGFIKIYGLIKLYKFIQQDFNFKNIYEYETNLLNEAAKRKCLLLHLLWVSNSDDRRDEYINDYFSKSTFGNFTFKLFQLLDISVLLKNNNDNSSSNSLVDWDDSLDFSFIIERLKPDLIESIHSSEASIKISLPSPRKIQPINTRSMESTSNTAATKDNSSMTQKELRKWFWWQHPHEYELIKGIILYIKHNQLKEGDLKGTLDNLFGNQPVPIKEALINLAIGELLL